MKKTLVIFCLLIAFIAGTCLGSGITNIKVEQLEKELLIEKGLPLGKEISYTIDSLLNSFDGYTGDQLEKALKNTPLKGTGASFSYFAWRNNISSIYLIAHAFLESARGTNLIAPYNIFGYGAYDRDPRYYAWAFESFNDCIATVSYHVTKGYLSPGGSWYVSPTLRGMNVYYATDKYWAQKIANIMNEIHYIVGAANSSYVANAENWYIQDFKNEDYAPLNLEKYVSKGQFIRDLYMLFPHRVYESAGEWAEATKLVNPLPKWWTNKITRDEEIEIIAKLYSKLHKFAPVFEEGDFYETYKNYYCILIWKLNEDLQEGLKQNKALRRH